jgi:hypothetical protein
MTKTSCAGTSVALLLALLPFHAQASDCDSNFASSGSLLTGKTYKTVAELPNVSANSAYQAAYLSIAKQGFIIRQSDSTARVISAQTNNSAPGREAPLNATIESSPTGAIITLIFATPAGAFSPEASVKDEFCKIVQAAAVPQQDTARSAATQMTTSVEDKDARNAQTDLGAGKVCLANACIGMSLEEAAKLNLKPSSMKTAPNANFAPIQARFGNYGLDANGKLVGMRSLAVDRVWIQQFLQTMRTMCQVPFQLNAQVAASDGTPVDLVFVLRKRNGKVEYGLSMISRLLPENMSVAERKNFENEVRQRYGRAYIENASIGKTAAAYNGQISEPAVILNPRSLQLLGPQTPGIAAQLMEQPGCSNKVSLD